MKKTISLVDREVYIEKLDNGLEIYLFPDNSKENYYINYFTKYGGADLSFYDSKGELINTNPGIAHFLEHKLFETEEGDGPFEFFAKSGSNVNAFTDYQQTAYVLSGDKNFLNNLDYVLDYVNSLYLTNENVEKEKGIIAEELRMYEDQANWKVNDIQSKMIYQKSNRLHDVGGKVSDILKISKEELEKCYEIFYQPSNMVLAISGDFKHEEALKVIKNNKKLMAKKNKFPIKKLSVFEPAEVAKREKNIYIEEVLSPRFHYVLKFNGLKDDYKTNAAATILVHLLFGNSSSFIEEEEGESFSLFQANNFFIDDNCFLEFTSNAKEPKEIIKKINKVIKQTPIDEAMLARSKKVMKGGYLSLYDDNGRICRSLTYHLINKEILLDIEELIDSMSLKDLDAFRKKIDIDNYSLLKVNYEDKSS